MLLLSVFNTVEWGMYVETVTLQHNFNVNSNRLQAVDIQLRCEVILTYQVAIKLSVNAPELTESP